MSELYSHANPLEKCCLVRPWPARAGLLAVASRVCHAMKFVHRETIQACVDSQDFSACLALLSELSKHFSKEMGST